MEDQLLNTLLDILVKLATGFIALYALGELLAFLASRMGFVKYMVTGCASVMIIIILVLGIGMVL